MLYIFHGDDQLQSKTAQSQLLDSLPKSDTLRLDQKSTTSETVNNFINSQTLFGFPKVLVLTNYFSIPKPLADKITPLLSGTTDVTIVLWQDKQLTQTQLKPFPQAVIKSFAPDTNIFSSVNAIRPGNLKNFIAAFRLSLKTQAFELISYFTKNTLRKQLATSSKFSQSALKSAYLNLIELEFQTKTGQLTTPKEIAFERIISQLINST